MGTSPNPNIQAQMPNQIQSPNEKQKYDLEERTAKFGEAVIEFATTLPGSPVIRPLISQLVRSATSIGANYMEGDVASSKKDFRNKIAICRKESKETLHWLRMIAKANPSHQEKCRNPWKEAREFVLIFSAILNKK